MLFIIQLVLFKKTIQLQRSFIMFDPYSGFESCVLGNGLTVYASQWKDRPWEHVGFVVHSGAASDPNGLEGMAHFVEHLLSKNVSLPYEELKEFFNRYGGGAKFGSTVYQTTSYSFFVPIQPAVLAQAFSLVAEMLLGAKLENFVERERNVVKAEITKKYPTEFSLDIALRERRMLYHDCWLGRVVRSFGFLESVDRITVADLQSFYDQHYVPANISVVAVGGLSLEEVIGVISESSFSLKKDGVRNPPIAPLSELAPPLENRYEVDLSDHLKTVAKNGVYFSGARIPMSIKPATLSLTSMFLDKILRRELRDKRAWTYAASSGWINYRCCYQFNINCEAFVVTALSEIEAVVNDCIMMIDNNDLLEEMRTRKLATFSMLDVSGGRVCDAVMDDVERYGRIISVQELIEAYQSVTMADIREVLSYLRPERRWTAISHP
jgi:predicted Zn-dependent peptidase